MELIIVLLIMILIFLFPSFIIGMVILLPFIILGNLFFEAPIITGIAVILIILVFAEQESYNKKKEEN